ncbi:MAG TPA: GxxExxY protein [Phycisphaerae bacterium]|nr:GxxExxY protein [Phycisphaerae bacterium]
MTQMNTDKDPRTHAVIGAAIEVHNHLGSGFLEAAYQEALAIELSLRGVPYLREVELNVRYKDRVLARRYKADFVCYDEIIVEVKALKEIRGPEQAQLLNYLKATGYPLGLLVNFGGPRLEYKRMIHSSHLCPSASSADKSSSFTE